MPATHPCLRPVDRPSPESAARFRGIFLQCGSGIPNMLSLQDATSICIPPQNFSPYFLLPDSLDDHGREFFLRNGSNTRGIRHNLVPPFESFRGELLQRLEIPSLVDTDSRHQNL